MNYPNRGITRRQLLERAIALGTLAVSDATVLLAQTAKPQPTPEQVMGPFYPILKPLDRDADLTVIAGKQGRAVGKLVHLTGRVLNSEGKPVTGAKIELWQANSHGRYDHPRDTNPAPLDPNFQGFGLQTTDDEGRYRFKTIKPGAYPIGGDSRRPPHIHFDVSGKFDRLVTQMYFPDEPLNEKDGIFKNLGSHQEFAIGKVLPPDPTLEPESVVVLWDIVLVKG